MLSQSFNVGAAVLLAFALLSCDYSRTAKADKERNFWRDMAESLCSKEFLGCMEVKPSKCLGAIDEARNRCSLSKLNEFDPSDYATLDEEIDALLEATRGPSYCVVEIAQTAFERDDAKWRECSEQLTSGLGIERSE